MPDQKTGAAPGEPPVEPLIDPAVEVGGEASGGDESSRERTNVTEVASVAATIGVDVAEALRMSPRQRLIKYFRKETGLARFNTAGLHETKATELNLRGLHGAFKTLVTLDAGDDHELSERLLIQKFLRGFFDMYDLKNGETHPVYLSGEIEEYLNFIVLLRDCYADENFKKFLNELIEELKSDLRVQLLRVRGKSAVSSPRSPSEQVCLLHLAKRLGIYDEPGNEDLPTIEAEATQEQVDKLFYHFYKSVKISDEERFRSEYQRYLDEIAEIGGTPNYKKVEDAFAAQYADFEEKLNEFEKDAKDIKAINKGQGKLRDSFLLLKSLYFRAGMLPAGSVTLTVKDGTASDFENAEGRYKDVVTRTCIAIATAHKEAVLAEIKTLTTDIKYEMKEKISRLMHDLEGYHYAVDSYGIADLTLQMIELPREVRSEVARDIIPARLVELITELATPNITGDRITSLSNHISSLSNFLRELSK
ncbi:MAG: hypothetical protein AAB592_01925 [Patescibacteria group bacterium]